MCTAFAGPNDGLVTASGQASTLTFVLVPATPAGHEQPVQADDLRSSSKLRLRNEFASSKVLMAGGCMCFIAWIILGLIAGFIAGHGVSNSGAGDFRPSPPQIQPYHSHSHSRPRQSQNRPDCFYFFVPCAVEKRFIRGPQRSCLHGCTGQQRYRPLRIRPRSPQQSL